MEHQVYITHTLVIAKIMDKFQDQVQKDGILGSYGGGGVLSVTRCTNNANVISSGGNSAGIVGSMSNKQGTISNCYNKGNVNGTNCLGGIVGYAWSGNVENCYNKGNITGTTGEIGGINGFYASIKRCYNTGNITATNESNGKRTGGIVGITQKDVSYCYNLGNVTGYDEVGGIAGYCTRSISNCYNNNENVTIKNNSSTRKGGLIIGNAYSGSTYSGSASGCGYYKGTSSLSGIGYLGSSSKYNVDTGCSKYTIVENMPTVLSIVGTAFKEDENNQNNGFPLLSWETDNDRLNLINAGNAYIEGTNGINDGYPLLAWQVKTN